MYQILVIQGFAHFLGLFQVMKWQTVQTVHRKRSHPNPKKSIPFKHRWFTMIQRKKKHLKQKPTTFSIFRASKTPWILRAFRCGPVPLPKDLDLELTAFGRGVVVVVLQQRSMSGKNWGEKTCQEAKPKGNFFF